MKDMPLSSSLSDHVIWRQRFGGEGVEPAAPAAAPAAVLPRRQRRRQVEIVDLDHLKADRADLKRQLKVCTKEVKAQAGW